MTFSQNNGKVELLDKQTYLKLRIIAFKGDGMELKSQP